MSAISIEKKILFIHIPKTGGTSIEEGSGIFDKWEISSRHDDLAHFKRFAKTTKLKLKKFFKFSIVRNPYDRIASILDSHFFNDISKEEFNEYILANLLNNVMEKNLIFRGQHTFICEDEKIAMDFVCRFENLESDWYQICKKIGMDCPLKPPVDSGQSYEDLYIPETRELVGNVYQRDFKIFHYEK